MSVDDLLDQIGYDLEEAHLCYNDTGGLVLDLEFLAGILIQKELLHDFLIGNDNISEVRFNSCDPCRFHRKIKQVWPRES